MNTQKQWLQPTGLPQLLIRLTLWIVIFPHGCQYLLGAFGGGGFNNTMQYLVHGAGLPAFLAMLVILLQFFGSLMLLIGLFTRFVSFSMMILFTGMILTAHLDHGFFMNWMGNQGGEGFEYHLLVIGMAISLGLSGAGACSVDAWIAKRYQLYQVFA